MRWEEWEVLPLINMHNTYIYYTYLCSWYFSEFWGHVASNRGRNTQQMRRKRETEKKKLSSLFLSSLAPKELAFSSLQLVFSLSHLQVVLSYLQRAGSAGGTLRHTGSHMTAEFPNAHLRKPQGQQVVLEGQLATSTDCTGSLCLLFCLTDWTLKK